VTARHRVPQPDDVSTGPGLQQPPQWQQQGVTVGGLFQLATRPRSIRGRLARILALSLTIVLVLLGVMALQQIRSYRTASATVDTVNLTLKMQDAIHFLQKERGLSNGLLGGAERFRPQVMLARTQADGALAALDRVLASRDDDDAVRVRDAVGKLGDLAGVRAGVDSGKADRTQTFAFYTNAIAAMNGIDLGLDRAQDPQLRHGLQALYALGGVKEQTGQERGFLNGVLAANHFNEGEYQHFADIRGAKSAALAEYDRFATQDQRAQLDAGLRSAPAVQAAQVEAVAVAAPSGKLARKIDPVTDWWNQMTSVIDKERTVQQTVGADITARADALRGSARTALILFLVLTGVAIGAQVFLVVGASRSIIGPLRSLAREADDVAVRRLPEAVATLQNTTEEQFPYVAPVTTPPHSGTEITQVAHALDRVQSTALALAGEQAVIRRNITESLANLGRRNQNLVRRQLGLISDFERDELDPSALANMFELDHLATRMRRNAESLLVLVGLTSPRPWSEPLQVTDVIRAGLSEVEEYRRVALRRVDDVPIVGSAVTEVAHMLAELIENALSFSPPDIEVEIFGRLVGQKYLLVVMDHGTGMSPDMLARANARLRGEEDFILAPTRFLGHYVIGRLAQRLGAEVELSNSPVTGVTARITLPADLLADTPSERPTALDSTGPMPALTRHEPAGIAPLDPYADHLGLVDPDPTYALPAPSRAAIDPAPAAGPDPAPSYGNAHRPLQRPLTVRDDNRAAPGASVPPTTPLLPGPRTGGSYRPAPGRPVAPQPTLQPGPQVAVPVGGSQGGPGEPERTRNGLVKRRPSNARASAAARPESRPMGSHPPAAPDRSPEEVRSMLSAFRSGHERGQSHQSN
jgi:signal transduction histidine kinase